MKDHWVMNFFDSLPSWEGILTNPEGMLRDPGASTSLRTLSMILVTGRESFVVWLTPRGSIEVLNSYSSRPQEYVAVMP